MRLVYLPVAVVLAVCAGKAVAETPREAIKSLCPTQLNALEARFSGAEHYSSADENPAVQNFWSQDLVSTQGVAEPVRDSDALGIMALGLILNGMNVEAADRLQTGKNVNAKNAEMMDLVLSVYECVDAKASKLSQKGIETLMAFEFCGYADTLSAFSKIFRSENAENLSVKTVLDQNLRDHKLCSTVRRAIG